MENTDWKRTSRLRPFGATLLPALTVLTIGIPAFAAGPNAGDSDSDSGERITVRKAVHLEDCPQVKVLGSGHARVLSLSPRTFLGVEASNLSPELREHFGVPGDAGVMLSKIVGDSAAEAAGLAVGDIVTLLDGDGISSISQLGWAVRDKEGGDFVEIEYWRDGEMYRTTATLEERERCSVDIGDPLRGIRIEDLGAIGELGIEIGGEALGSTLEILRGALAGQDWESHLEGLEEIDLERIEERMERAQERLERLEERLERDFGREFERAERELERAKERVERDHERRERALERAERERERAEDERERAEDERERALERAELERERAEDEREDGEGELL